MPLFESEQDRRYEKAFADYLRKNYPLNAFKLDKKYGPDFFVSGLDGEPRSWVEFKQRSARILTDWDSHMISSFKIWRGRSIAESTSLKFYVAIGVEIGDVIHYHQCHITQDVIDNSRIEIGGRSDRGYAGDMEPMFFIPLSHFSEI